MINVEKVITVKYEDVNDTIGHMDMKYSRNMIRADEILRKLMGNEPTMP